MCRTRRLLALVLLIGGCAPSGEGVRSVAEVTTPSSADDPWASEVDARLRDEAHAFVAQGEAFVAQSPGHGIAGHFDAAGARLEGPDEGIGVRTVRWGRAGAAAPVPPAPPRLGTCIAGRADPEGACIRRLEYADAGILAWWSGSEEGFEQGWTVNAPPAGGDSLVIDVAIDGAAVTVGEDELWLDGDGGGWWTVSGLTAQDADGVGLDATFEAVDGGFRVKVADAGARYPVEVDPVYASATTAFTGEATGNYLGNSVSAAGDVNGDGYDDVVVGAQGYSTNTGRAYVYHGSASGPSSTASTTLTGASTHCYFAYSVTGAGDVNGDGYDDVVVGEPSCGSDIGRASVYHGSASGLSAAATVTLTEGGDFGRSVSAAGDVNGDGYDDVVVGAPFEIAAYVHAGSPSGLSSAASTTLTGEGMASSFGISVSGAGDVNGDGYDDVVVGAYNYGSGSGRAYVYSGSAGGVSSAASTTLPGGSGLSYFGVSVSGAGDVNGDGYDDVVVGAYGTGSSAGSASVYHGSSGGLSASASTGLSGEASLNHFGLSVSGAGDVNGDGYDDIVVGANRYGSSTGRAYVYTGSASGVATAADATLTGGSGDRYGYSVSGAGDVNGDGYDDIVVGAIASSTYTGRAYVYHGYVDADGDGYAAAVDCADDDPTLNPGAIERCDAADTDEDCDGLADDADGTVTGQSTTHADADGDGYGDPTAPATTCDVPAAHVADATDCDDADASVYPAATEVVGDEVDESCDGTELCYDDDDDDGTLDTSADTLVSTDSDCADANEAGASEAITDCDDASASVYLGATEVVGDGIDEDCDGVEICYADLDGDGFGTSTIVAGTALACDGAGESARSDDCDDTDASLNPGATEVVGDEVDQSCDGRELCYDDGDDDGTLDSSGDRRVSTDTDCADAREGTAADATTDCDDGSASVYVGAPETTADGIDQDCDGGDDCYADVDGDGYGDTGVVTGAGLACDGVGESARSDDCDPASAATWPGAPEVPGDGIDEDCDGSESCFVDADGDGQGSGVAVTSANLACDGAGESPSSVDCDDGDAAVFDGAEEVPADGADQDCDGLEDCFADTDADGFGDADTLVASADFACGDEGVSASADDCHDADPGVHPSAAPELPADGVDQDCDGLELCFLDADLDAHGAGDPSLGASLACDAAGVSAVADDCNDADPGTFPGAGEVVADGIDQDCDGGERCHADEDGDGYGSEAEVASADLACINAREAVDGTDCDDTVSTTFPGANETCNNVDDDCDGALDDGAADCDAEHDRTLCGCSTGSGAAWSIPLVAVAALSLRRRRSSR